MGVGGVKTAPYSSDSSDSAFDRTLEPVNNKIVENASKSGRTSQSL